MGHTLKLLVGGPFSSGKTAFISSITELEDVFSTLKTSESVSLDFGRLTIIEDDLILYIFARPGGRNLESVFNDYPEFLTQSLGCLLMVDSAQYLRFAEANSELQTVSASGLPYMVVANKQDKSGAVSPRQLRQILNIPEQIQVLPCITKDEAHVRRVLIEFFRSLPQDENIRLVLDKITTQAALDLDLSQYDQRPDVELP